MASVFAALPIPPDGRLVMSDDAAERWDGYHRIDDGCGGFHAVLIVDDQDGTKTLCRTLSSEATVEAARAIMRPAPVQSAVVPRPTPIPAPAV